MADTTPGRRRALQWADEAPSPARMWQMADTTPSQHNARQRVGEAPSPVRMLELAEIAH